MILICKYWKNIALSLTLAAGIGTLSAAAHAQDNPGPQAQVSHRSMVRSAQQQLKTNGYYTGAIDGMNGPMTRAAIRKYQGDNNLAVNGRLDLQTREKLGLQPAATAGEASRAATGTNQEATGTNQAPALPAATVSAAQRSLKKKGFYKGNIDGAMTAETQAAIREYQKNSNLNVTGQLDSATLSNLGVSK
jgi:peptidoglycan hydrolase-like protein with peptidoglycan-binding domain